MGPDAERKLIASCKNGDTTAYAELVKAYSGCVYAICLAMLGNRHDAEDVTQQTLLKGFMQIGELRKSQRFGAWIGRIARNASIDMIRQIKRDRRIDPSFKERSDWNDERHRRLEAALSQLKPKYRTPLLMFYFDGRDTAGIGRMLGISQAAVQTRLSRARQQLREILGTEANEP